MTLGRCYVAVNAGFPGRVKIGATTRTARQRVSQLRKHYGTKHEFTEDWSVLCHNPFAVEALAHRRLDHCRDHGTEIFRCSVEEARTVILWAVDEALRCPIQPRPERAAKRWRRARYSYQEWHIAIVLTTAIIGVLIWLKPDLPNWLPDNVQRAGNWIERLR